MATKPKAVFPLLRPDLQVSFYYRLKAVRELYFHEALRNTIAHLDLKVVDHELGAVVQKQSLAKVASWGLRGEVLFPVPCILRANPSLLGYYRLLYGISQKDFYSGKAFGRFKRLEESGEIPVPLDEMVPALCRSLAHTGQLLVAALDNLSLDVVRDLQLLTIGPQLRGSVNTGLGKQATKEVYDLILSIVKPYVREKSDRRIAIENESGRTVLIEFFSDPDVRITEALESRVRPLVSIEIKGGRDFSNIHNRLGEAEKSHQKAKSRGFFEFWTIIRVDLDHAAAKRESPTTSHLFNLDRIRKPNSPDAREFSDLLASITGIRTAGKGHV